MTVCLILLSAILTQSGEGTPPATASGAPEVTFTREIAPVMFRACSTCHHPGDVAPFSLLTYDDAAKRARQIARVVERRIMPPWMPAATKHPFSGERALPQHEIDLFVAWAAAGAPEGDPKNLPSAPVFSTEWKLGTPDIILEMEQDFEVPADGPDVYHNFVLPITVPEGKWIKGLDLHPSSRRVVHHCLICLDTKGYARRRDARESGYGYSGMSAGYPMQYLVPYAPGTSPQFFPDGVAIDVPPESDIVLLTHFYPIGKPERERSKVGVYLTDTPPTRHMTEIPIPFAFGYGSGLDIPAGAKNYVSKQSFTVPVAVEAIGLIPHAHQLCVEMRGRAHLPDGTVEDLFWIPSWNFAWQEVYRYATPVALPANTRIEAEYTYDNSADNPGNPNSPPKRVKWGRNTTDEMIYLGVQVMPVRNGDMPMLESAMETDRLRVVRPIRMRRYAIQGGLVVIALAATAGIAVFAKRYAARKRRAA